MLKIDNAMLDELGLKDLPDEEKKALLAHLYETLEMRVGKELASRMSDQQLNEFEAFVDSNDEEGALKWLEENFPNYKDVVADQLEELKKEIQEQAKDILKTSSPEDLDSTKENAG